MKTLPFYLLLITTFGLAGIEKLIAFKVPAWFVAQFHGSLLDLFPGSIEASFILITLMELSTFFLLLIGLALKHKNLLSLGIILAQLTFVSLAFGQRLTHQFEMAGALFFYAALTFIGGQYALKEEA